MNRHVDDILGVAPNGSDSGGPVDSAHGRPSGTFLRDFLVFRRMVTPILIQIAFWLGVIACVVVGFLMLNRAAELEEYRKSAEMLRLQGIGLIVLGPFAVRIYCEFMILLFRMSETLTDIKNRLTQ